MPHDVLLEDRGLISTRARSGSYVNARQRLPLAQPDTPPASDRSTAVDVIDLLFDVLERLKGRSVVPLGSAFISPALFPHAELAQPLGVSARRLDPSRAGQNLPSGNSELRRHIARRYLECGAEVGTDELVAMGWSTSDVPV